MKIVLKLIALAACFAVSHVALSEEPQSVPAPGPRKKYSQKELQETLL